MSEQVPRYIVFQADDTFSSLFWDDEDVAIGDYESFFIGDDEYTLSSLEGLKEWFYHADKYDPYTDVAQFSTDGMEEWINLGYEFAKQVRDYQKKLNYIMHFGISSVTDGGGIVEHI